MNKFLTPLLLAAALSPLAASAQYYDGQRGDYRVESRDGYYYNGRYYDTDRRGGYTYNGRYYNADHRDKRGRFDPRFDPRYTSNSNGRYNDNRYDSGYNNQGYEYDSYGNRVVCRDVVVRDRNEGAAVAGAIIGGVLGNQIGSGSGRTAATVGGAVVGGLVGNEVSRDRHGNRIERRCERY